MTEKPETAIVELKKEDRELLKSTIEALKGSQSAGSSSETVTSPSKEPESQHQHWKAEDLQHSDCPECKAELEKIGSEYMKKTMMERKDKNKYPWECIECGTHVRTDEETCPTCGSAEAKTREDL